MIMRKLLVGIAMSFAVCLLGSQLALAYSGSGASIHSCVGDVPGERQAYLYSYEDYNGTCWAIDFLYTGYPYWQNMWAGYDTNDAGFRNDDIRSVKVGSSVSIVMFWHSFGTASHGVPLRYGNNARINNLGSWNDNVSAIRLLSGRLQERCQNAYDDKIIIWDDATEAPINSPDCNVLYVESIYQQYPNPASMAFRNDSISAFQVVGSLNRDVVAHETSDFFSPLFRFLSSRTCDLRNMQSSCSGYSTCGDIYTYNCTTTNVNDRISSISVE